MSPSPTLLRFLSDGTKPASQRETSALLDECFSVLQEIANGKSKLTNQGDHIPAAQFNARAQTALAKSQAARQPATIHQKSADYRAAQGRPPLSAAATPAKPPANKYYGADLGLVAQAATHRSSPETDKAAALAELAARGVTLNPNGTVAFSVQGGRAAKIAAKLASKK